MKIQKRKQNLQWLIALICLALAALAASLLFDARGSRTAGLSEEQPENAENGQAEPVELELVYAYQNAQWNAAVEHTVEEFERLYPDIHVSYEVNYGDKVYEDILSRKIARNELGDIVQLKTPEAYAESGLLGGIREDVSDLVTSVYQYEGETCGVGAVRATSGVIYRKDLFEKYHLQEPRTYGEFLDICRALKAHRVTPVGVGGSDLWHLEYWVNHFFRTDVLLKNEDWLTDCMEGKVSWLDGEPAAMLGHLKELFDSGFINEDWLMTTDGSLPYQMSEGEIAMIYTGPWTEAAIRALSPDMELGWFYIPDAEGTVCAGENLDTFWSVTKDCAADAKKYEAAMKFLTFFYSRDNYTEVCRSTDTFPLTREDISCESTEIQRDIRESFAGADRRIPTYIGNEDTPEEFERAMLMILREVLAGGMPQKEGLEHVQDMWEQLEAREDVS